MTRIFIEDYELDVDNTLSNQITYAIDDLNNLDSKATAFSKTIVVPGTTNNNDLLGNIFEFNNANFTNDSLPNVKYNFNASKSARCRIEVNGLQIVKGVFRLLEIVYDDGNIEYECAVFGELGGFVSKLANRKLEDLDFSAYDHTYSIANITSSWNNAGAGSGYYYPLIDYGNVSADKKDYQYKAFRPALFVREYIDKIITGNGYTWESNFFDTAFFKRLIIPNNSKQLSRFTSSVLLAEAGFQQTAGAGGVTLNIDFSTVTTSSFTYNSGTREFTYTDINTNTYDISVIANAFYAISATLNIIKNGSTIASVGSGGPSPETLEYLSSISFSTGDTLKIQLTGTNAVGITSCTLSIGTAVPTLVPVILGDTLVMDDTIPRGIFQKDFFASILKMFYLMVTEDKFKERHLIIEPWVNFFDTTPSSYIDWSDKVDRSKQIRVKPMSEINARYYQLSFKQDNDFYNENYRKKYNEGYGDRIYDNGYEFAKDIEKVEVIFASSVLYGKAGEDKVVPAIYKVSNNQQAEDSMEHVIRIMQAKKITGVASWDIMDEAAVLSSNTDYGYAGHLDDPDAPNADLCFGVPKELFFVLVTGNLSNNLFNTYYSAYFAEITDKDSRLLQAMVKLSEVDIYNLDFSKFYFIDGGLYRLSKLIDYTAGANEPTKAELLRVIYTIY